MPKPTEHVDEILCCRPLVTTLMLVVIMGMSLLVGAVYASEIGKTVQGTKKNSQETLDGSTKGGLHALVVGVSKYRDPNIPSLDLADRDAQAFGEFLQGQTRIFAETRVTFLLNEKATKAELEKYLYYMLPKAGKDDTVVLFLSGHGAFDPMRPKEFLFLPYDAEADYVSTSGVKMSGLEFLKGISAPRVVIIADACHAGGFSPMKPKALTPSLELFLKEARNSSGRAIISSAKDGQLSWELPDGKNSVFTHNLLEGLRGKADRDHDGIVNLNEAYEFAYNRTRDDTKGRQHPQFEGTFVGSFPLSFVGPGVSESELRKRFFQLALTGDFKEVEKLISQGAEADWRDAENSTALISAAGNGHTEVVNLLLIRGADVNASNNSRLTALCAAAEKGHSAIVNLLLAASANVESKDSEGMTALALACLNGHLEVAEKLLTAGAEVKVRTNAGNTPLILACQGGHKKLVELLLRAGADVNARNLAGLDSLTQGCRSGNREVAKLLLEKNAILQMKNGGALELELARASALGDLRQVTKLIAFGVKIDAETVTGDTALTLAAGLGNVELLRILASSGANLNFRIGGSNPALLAAADSGNHTVVGALLKLGADGHARDAHGNTALGLAARQGKVDMVKLLLDRDAEVNSKNSNGTTPLMDAAEHGHTDLVRLLVRRGGDVNTRDKMGNTALMLASHYGHADVVKHLMGRNPDIEARNSEMCTALLLAARNGHASVVRLLVLGGADVSVQDWEGKTAVSLASDTGQTEIEEILKSARTKR